MATTPTRTLTIALLATLVLAFGALAATGWAVIESRDEAAAVARREEHTAYLVGAVALDTSRLRSILFDAIALPGDTSPTRLVQAHERLASAQAGRRAVPGWLEDEELDAWHTLEPHLDRLLERLERVIEDIEAGDRAAATATLHEGTTDALRLFEELAAFERASVQQTDRAILQIETRTDHTIRTAGFALAGLVCAMGLAWMWVLRIVAAQRRAIEAKVEELERANRELDAFAGRVAHDMRDVLSPIHTGVAALATVSREPSVVGIGHRIGRACDRGRDLVDALLQFSRAAGNPGDRARVAAVAAQAHEVLEELDEAVRATAADITLRAPEDAAVAVSPALLHVVLRNLVGNALKALEDRRERRLAIEVRQTGDEVAIVVRDSGAGIDPSEQARVFEALYRGKRAPGKGIGLGLATVRRIVEAHGGRVDLASIEGRGTSVTIVLPRAHTLDVAVDDSTRAEA